MLLSLVIVSLSVPDLSITTSFSIIEASLLVPYTVTSLLEVIVSVVELPTSITSCNEGVFPNGLTSTQILSPLANGVSSVDTMAFKVETLLVNWLVPKRT